MLRGNMMRLVCAVAGVAMVVSGCNCPGPNPPVDCTDTTLTFETPTAGQSVDSPFEVAINVKKADGSVFLFDAATLSVGGASFTGTVTDNRATFTGVTATPGAQTLTATIAQGTCSKSASTEITVRDACSNPAVLAVSFPQDAAPFGVLNRAELPPGTNLQVKVDASCVSGVQVRIKRGNTEVSPLTSFVNGTVTVTLPTLPDADNARYDLFAELVKDGVALNTASTPGATASIQVSRALPGCAITTTGTFGPGADADSSTPGFQMRVTGTMATDAAGTLGVTGQTPVIVTPSGTGDVSADFTLSMSGDYVATLICNDANGNSNSATGSFTLDFDAPTVAILSPASADGGNAEVTQSPTQVQVMTNAEDGAMAIIKRDGVNVGNGTVSGGMVTLPVSFGIDGTYVIDVEITDLAGNTGTATVTVNVTLDGCGAIFSRPGTCPALLTQTQVVGGFYQFQTTSKAACANQPASLFRSNVLADGGVTAEAPAGMTTLAAGGVATYPPTALGNGDYIFRGEVSNIGADAGVSTVSCRVTVDLDGPAITSPVRPTGAPYAIVNANQDSLPSVPGVQRPASIGGLTFSARVPVGGRVDVCTTQQFNAATGMNRPTSPACGSGWYLLAQGVVSPVDLFTFPEGAYQIKIVVVGGGLAVPPESPPLAILSDSIRPCLTARRLPQDANMDSRLNIAELGTSGPQIEFALGCGDTSPADLSATDPARIRDIVLGAPAGFRPAIPSFAAGKYTATLTVPAATEVDLSIFVELTDLAGNKNLFQASNDPSSYTVRVDPIAPACDIISPAATQTLVGIAGAPGNQFTMQVGTSADVTTNGVTMAFGSAGSALATPTNQVAQTNFPVSGTASYAATATCRDAAGNATTATPRNVTVDLDAPTCSITAPTTGSYATNRLLTTVTVGGAEGRPVTIRSSLQTAPITTTLLVTSGVASATLQYPKGVQTVTADVQDAAGNACTQASVSGINVTSDACALDLRNVVVNAAGSWKNRSLAAALTNLTATTADMTGLIANSPDCQSGERVTLQLTAPTTGPLIELVTDTSGNVVLPSPVSVADNQTWTLTAYSPTATQTTATFRVGLKVPQATGMTINGFAPAAAQPLYFVAATDNVNLNPNFGPPKTDRYFADQAGSVGAQAAVVVSGATGLVYGTDQGLIEVLYAPSATPLLSQPVMSEPYALPSSQISLQHNTSGAFTVRLTSAAGNTADFLSTTAAVDVLAPGQPLMSALVLSSARTASVTVDWSTVYDDGVDSASGALTGGSPMSRGYDLRWTTGAVYGNAMLANDAAYFSASNVSTVVDSSTARPYALELPPLNTYYVIARARDELGNYSEFRAPTDAQAITKTQSLVNMWGGDVQLTVTGAGTDFGTTVAAESSVIGSEVNDAGVLLADVVVASPGRGGAGSVYVFKGKNPFTAFSGACAGADCQELVAPDALGTVFGGDVSTGGNVADNATEQGVADLVIGQRGYSTTGRVFIYLGTRMAAITQFVEIRGDASNTNIGQTAQIIKDIDGDGYDELAISAFSFGGNRGRVYVFKGRSFAAWGLLGATVPITAADWVIEGESILPADPVNTSNGLALSRLGMISTPGYTGRTRADGGVAPEFIVPLSRVNLSRFVVYGYDRLQTASVAAPLGVLDGGIQTIARVPPGTSINNAYLGLGASAYAGAVQGSTDLYVGNPYVNEVYRYSNWGAGGVVSGNSSQTISGPTYFGGQIAAANLDKVGSGVDLVVAEGGLSNNGAWVLYQRAGNFDSALGGTNIRFWVSEFRPIRVGQVTVSSVAMQTRAMSLGDVDGVSGPDLVLSDATTGVVHVWR